MIAWYPKSVESDRDRSCRRAAACRVHDRPYRDSGRHQSRRRGEKRLRLLQKELDALSDNEKALADGKAEYDEKKAAYDEKKAAYDEKYKQYEAADKKYNEDVLSYNQQLIAYNVGKTGSTAAAHRAPFQAAERSSTRAGPRTTRARPLTISCRLP